MVFYLIKFQHKAACRLLLRKLKLKLNLHLIAYSSIFKLLNPNFINDSDYNKQYYMLISIHGDAFDLSKDLLLISDITIITDNIKADNNALITLFNWAYYEITQSLEFVKIETQTTFAEGNYGRQLIINFNGINLLLIRTFEYLPEIFGIINYTIDSFSDGGLHTNINLVCKRIEEYVVNNVGIIDIGVESTRPNAIKLTPDLEISRLKEILPAVLDMKKYYNNQFKISIDTYHAATAAYLNDIDVDIINDVSGKIAGNIIKDLVINGKRYLAMHSTTIPADRNKIININSDVVEYIYVWMCQKLDYLATNYQIDSTSIILDPGIGFGNNSAQAWYIINKLDKFRTLPCEILLGHSRKSFLNHIVDKNAADRDLETAIVAVYSMPNVDYLRLHDINVLNTIYSVQSNLRTCLESFNL